MTDFLNCKPQVQYVLSASVSDRFLTPNVETRSSLSNCVAGPAGMRLLWGFPEVTALHPASRRARPTPTPPQQLKQGRSLTADNCTHGYNDSYLPAESLYLLRCGKNVSGMCKMSGELSMEDRHF